MSDSTGKYSTLKRSGSEENLQKANGNNWTESLETLLADSAGKLAFAAFLQDWSLIKDICFWRDTVTAILIGCILILKKTKTRMNIQLKT